MLRLNRQGNPVKGKTFDIAVTLGCLSLLAYFGWHAFHGPRSFDNRTAIEAEAERLEASLARFSVERTTYDARVALIRPQSIDPDLLDELARRSLGYVRRGEIVLEITPEKGE
jgi:cell division protein FtsB